MSADRHSLSELSASLGPRERWRCWGVYGDSFEGRREPAVRALALWLAESKEVPKANGMPSHQGMRGTECSTTDIQGQGSQLHKNIRFCGSHP